MRRFPPPWTVESKAKREARAKKNTEELAKMGKEEGTHTEPGHGAPPESDTSKVDQPERRNPTTGNETPKQSICRLRSVP